jgi:hypothetical protein
MGPLLMTAHRLQRRRPLGRNRLIVTVKPAAVPAAAG